MRECACVPTERRESAVGVASVPTGVASVVSSGGAE
jgi:hypothetical protein